MKRKYQEYNYHHICHDNCTNGNKDDNNQWKKRETKKNMHEIIHKGYANQTDKRTGVIPKSAHLSKETPPPFL